MNNSTYSPAGLQITQAEHIAVIFQKLVESNAVIHIFCQDEVDRPSADKNTAFTALSLSNDRRWMIVDGNYSMILFPEIGTWKDWVGVSFVDAVKITFTGASLQMCQWQGKTCFAFPIPNQLHQIQRRSFYRIETDDSMDIDLQLIDAEGQSWPTDVLNVSLGGCALHLPNDSADHFSIPGQYQALLRLNSQHSLVFKIELLIQYQDTEHLSPVLEDGVIIGCRYLLENDTQAKILQRFVVNAERQQRARANGLTV